MWLPTTAPPTPPTTAPTGPATSAPPTAPVDRAANRALLGRLGGPGDAEGEHRAASHDKSTHESSLPDPARRRTTLAIRTRPVSSQVPAAIRPDAKAGAGHLFMNAGGNRNLVDAARPGGHGHSVASCEARTDKEDPCSICCVGRSAASRPACAGRSLASTALLIAANVGVWVWAAIVFASHPLLLGTAFLAYRFGLRHAVDADHIAAIDNVTRKLMQEGGRPVTVGFFFALGHSAVVMHRRRGDRRHGQGVQLRTIQGRRRGDQHLGVGAVPVPDRGDEPDDLPLGLAHVPAASATAAPMWRRTSISC